MLKKLLMPTLLLSSISFGLLLNDNNTFDIAKADIEDKCLYIDLSKNSKYLEDNSNPYLYYYDGSNYQSVSLTVLNNNVYKTVSNIDISIFDISNNQMEIRCFDGSILDYQSDYLDNSKLSQIGYNYICLDSYVTNQKNSVKGYGYYGDKTEDPGSTYLTQKVWLNNDNQYFYDGDKYINAVGYIYNNEYKIIKMTMTVNTFDGMKYYYVNIPYDVSNIHFLRLSSSDSDYLIYQDVNIYLSYGVCYFAGVMSLEDYSNIATGNVDKADANILGSVMEAYLTFGKYDSNGATTNTIKNIYQTWFKNKSASRDDLKNKTILDYRGYRDGTYEYATKDAPYSLNEKWNTICAQAGINPDTGEPRGIDWGWFATREFAGAAIIGGTAILIIGGIVVVLIIKKKKEN